MTEVGRLLTGVAFASDEPATYWRYISSSLDRLVDVAASMDAARLSWTPPAPDTNSVAVLVVHTLGNAEENILETLCGQSVQRDRESEFLNCSTTINELQERWSHLRPRLEAALAQPTQVDIESAHAHPRRGTVSGREILIVVGRHAAEHLGQAELTRDLWLAATR